MATLFKKLSSEPLPCVINGTWQTSGFGRRVEKVHGGFGHAADKAPTRSNVSFGRIPDCPELS